MDIEDLGWNSFRIPIKSKDSETETEYLIRVGRCLDLFYLKNTSLGEGMKAEVKPIDIGYPPSLTVERNFCEMYLKGIEYCDVKFRVEPEDLGLRLQGIHVWSHSDDKNLRKPMVDFLREKWKEFDYKF